VIKNIKTIKLRSGAEANTYFMAGLLKTFK